MYATIVVPVDLAHTDKFDKALSTATDLAKHYSARLCFVGVTASAPRSVARDPEAFAQALDTFAAKESAKRDIDITTMTITSPDPAGDLDDTLRHAVEHLGADLVVMASHVPGFGAHVFASNAGYLASHTSISIFIVR